MTNISIVVVTYTINQLATNKYNEKIKINDFEMVSNIACLSYPLITRIRRSYDITAILVTSEKNTISNVTVVLPGQLANP